MDIITTYILTMKALHHLDPSDHLLSLLNHNIKSYLRLVMHFVLLYLAD